jgi:GT2 family glycosyltransferase
MSLLSICIVNWNTRDFLRETLASIYAYPPEIDMEVIVVDNASGDGSAKMVEDEFPAVQLILNTSNAGYASANNQALDASAGDWLLLLNPDVRLDKTTLADSLIAASELADFGVLGIKQVGPDGQIQQSLRTFPEPIGVLWTLLGLSKLFPHSRIFASYRMTWFDYNSTIEVDQPMATFLLTTREVYKLVGGMDTRFPIFFNDVDWCYRIKRTGRKIYYTERAQVWHYGGAATSRAKRSKMAAASKQSFLTFYDKYYREQLPDFVYRFVCGSVKMSLAVGLALANVKRLAE